MTQIKNNSPGRLLQLIRSFQDERGGEPLLAATARCYGDVLSLPHDWNGTKLTSDIVGFQFDVSQLVDEVQRDCTAFADENENYQLYLKGLSTLEAVRQSFSPNQQVQHFNQNVVNDALEMSLFAFSEAMPAEGELDVDDVTVIRGEIDALMSKIEASDLPKSIREFLFHLQRMSRDMLDRYRISGSRGLRDQFHKILGEMADTYRRDDKKKSDNESLWMQVFGWIHRVDNAVAKAGKYPELVDKSGAAVETLERLFGG